MIFLIYALATLALALSLILLFKQRNMHEHVIVIVLFALFVIAMGYLASQIHFEGYADIDRMHEEMLYTRTYGLSYLLKRYLINPGSALLLYVFSPSASTSGLQAFAGIVFYGALAHVLYVTYRYCDFPAPAFIITCLLGLSFFVLTDIVGGVRNFPAMALCSAAIISMSIKQKHGVSEIIICIFAGLLHAGAWLPLLLYLITSALPTRLRKIWYVALSLYGFFAIAGLRIAVKYLPGKSFWENINMKVNGYFLGGTSFELFSSLNKMIFMYYTLCFVVMLLCLVKLFNNKSTRNILSHLGTLSQPDKYPFLNNYMAYLIAFTCFCIGSIPSGTPFRRYTVMLLFNALPFIASALTCFFYQEFKITDYKANTLLSASRTDISYMRRPRSVSIPQFLMGFFVLVSLIFFAYCVWRLSDNTYL